MSLELDQLGQLAARARPPARRGPRAARAGCSPSRAARRPPPRWRTRAVSPLSSSAMPYSLTCSPRLTAAVRSASLCLPEPVKCWSRLPKPPPARCAGRRAARCGSRALAPASPGVPAPRRSAASAPKRLDQRRRVARRRHDVEVLARVGHAPGAPGQLDPIGGRVLAQRRDSSSPTASAFESSMRALALPSAPAASAARTFSSALAPKPGHVLEAPVLGAALRRSSSDSTPELLVEQPRALRAEARGCG